MKPIFERARERPMRVVFSDGEEFKRAARRAGPGPGRQRLVEPILIGRPDVIKSRIERLGLSLDIEKDVELCNPLSDPRYNDYVAHYHERRGRRGVTPVAAREIIRTRTSAIAAVMVDRGEADAMIAGPTGRFVNHLNEIEGVLGRRRDMHDMSTLHLVILENRPLFFADTYVSYDPSAEEMAETTVRAADMVKLVWHRAACRLWSPIPISARAKVRPPQKMREVLELVRDRAPELEVDGEMHADTALSAAIRATSCRTRR